MQVPVVVFAKKLVEQYWGGVLIEDVPKKQNNFGIPRRTTVEQYGTPIMDAASAALLGDDDDDHMLFTTDQLEEDLNGTAHRVTNGSSNHMFQDAQEYLPENDQFYDARQDVDNETTAADSIPSLHTAQSGRSSKRRRKPSPKLRQQPQQQQQRQRQFFAPADPPKPPPKARKKVAPKKKTPAVPKRKIEPLAKQVIPGSGRGARQKMFTWDDRMVQLAEYKEKFGHIAIPTVRRDPYYNLGLWLAAQRSLYRKNSLRKERLNDLRKLGCVGFGGPGG